MSQPEKRGSQKHSPPLPKTPENPVKSGVGEEVLYFRPDRGAWEHLFNKKDLWTRRGLIRSLRILVDLPWATMDHVRATIEFMGYKKW